MPRWGRRKFSVCTTAIAWAIQVWTAVRPIGNKLTRMRQELARSQQSGRSVCLLTGTIHSPTTRAAIQQFLADKPGSRHIVYDPLSASAMAAAHQQTHGLRVIPHYRFDRADVIVALGADFLGTWISPVEYTAGYQAGRSPREEPPRMSYHLQIEARMSLTGCNADERWVVPPDALGAVAGRLATELARLAKRELAGTPPIGPIDDAHASKLWRTGCGQREAKRWSCATVRICPRRSCAISSTSCSRATARRWKSLRLPSSGKVMTNALAELLRTAGGGTGRRLDDRRRESCV